MFLGFSLGVLSVNLAHIVQDFEKFLYTIKQESNEHPLQHLGNRFEPLKSLPPGRCGCDFKCENSNLGVEISFTRVWMLEDTLNDKSTVIQVMAWWSKSIPEPVLTNISRAILNQWATISWLISPDKMTAISRTTFSNAFSWMKMYEFRVPKGPINNIPALVQIIAWRRPGDKPLSEPMMVRLPTHIASFSPYEFRPLKKINT